MIINGSEIRLGERKVIKLQVAKLYDHMTSVELPIEVIRGKKEGPCLFISAAMHGDEINGVETIRRLLSYKALKNLRGTLIVAPIVNVFGFNSKSRYLPDRRDLNRCFPGSPRGSLASRLAHLFLTEVVDKCGYGIDLHTAAIDRVNLPQIRVSLDDPKIKKLARSFGSPVILNSKIRKGSLREALLKKDIKLLLFEGGEALRFDEASTKIALRGIFRIMKELGMLEKLPKSFSKTKKDTFIAKSSYWVRAQEGGIMIARKKLGDKVTEGEVLGIITDPFPGNEHKVRAKQAGIIIGNTQVPLVNEGDGLFHIATFKDLTSVEQGLDDYEDFFLD